jgi:hypothetical protein
MYSAGERLTIRRPRSCAKVTALHMIGPASYPTILIKEGGINRTKVMYVGVEVEGPG